MSEDKVITTTDETLSDVIKRIAGGLVTISNELKAMREHPGLFRRHDDGQIGFVKNGLGFVLLLESARKSCSGCVEILNEVLACNGIVPVDVDASVGTACAGTLASSVMGVARKLPLILDEFKELFDHPYFYGRHIDGRRAVSKFSERFERDISDARARCRGVDESLVELLKRISFDLLISADPGEGDAGVPAALRN